VTAVIKANVEATEGAAVGPDKRGAFDRSMQHHLM
jgi:hypothetical protein